MNQIVHKRFQGEDDRIESSVVPAGKLRFKQPESETGYGQFEGYAAVWREECSFGDYYYPGAFKNSLFEHEENGQGIPLCWQHLYSDPIGYFSDIHEDDTGLFVRGEVDLSLEKGRQAWAMLKDWNYGGLSTSTWWLDYEWDDFYFRTHVYEVELFEISLVTWPAQKKAIAETRAKRKLEPDLTRIERALKLRQAVYGK